MIRRFHWQILFLVLALVLVLVACSSDLATPDPTSGQSPETSRPPDSGPTLAPTPVTRSSPAEPGPTPAGPTPALAPDVVPTPIPVPLVEEVFQLPNIADTVDKVRPAVVGIVAEFITRDFLGNLVSTFSSGTGVIFSPEGLALTNSHVIRGASAVTITRDDGTQLPAEMVGFDRLSDLSVLRLPEGTYPFLPIEDGSENLRVGDWVIAIGNALALPGDLTVTVGVVSALGRTLDVSEDVTLYDLIQTDAVVNPGNSGGPLLNLHGELVGINTAILRQSSFGSRTTIEGMGFAINTETATLVSGQLVESRRVRWAWMGAFLGDLIPELAAQAGMPISEGVVIRDVLTNGPADSAGIQRGDIILSIGGFKVSTVRDLTRILRQEFIAAQEIEVELFRNGATLTLPMVLGERPR